MEVHKHNLNIHYTAPKDNLYAEMPHWNGYVKGISTWYGQENGGKLIDVSVESGGLQFYANLPQQEWDEWFSFI